MKNIFFIDTEVSITNKKVCDFGAINGNDDKLHTKTAHEFDSFIRGAYYICGHNIINHDVKYIGISNKSKLIDTLYLSPLLFPNKPSLDKEELVVAVK